MRACVCVCVCVCVYTRAQCVLQSSGVTVKQECVAVFTDIKLGHKYRYVVYALTDDLTQIHVLKTAPPSTSKSKACDLHFKALVIRP